MLTPTVIALLLLSRCSVTILRRDNGARTGGRRDAQG